VIPQANIVEWSNGVPWPTIEQVEQDLLLSRLIIEIAEDPYLGKELAFRGGTCLHKLHIVPGLRYSEDLDYVRRTADGIGDVFDALRAIGDRLGMDGRTARGAYPKVYLRAPFESGSGTMRIKIEVNTHERSPARELIRHPFTVESAWYEGTADVLTFSARSSSPPSCERSTSDSRVATFLISGSPSTVSASIPPRSWQASPRTARRRTPPCSQKGTSGRSSDDRRFATTSRPWSVRSLRSTT